MTSEASLAVDRAPERRWRLTAAQAFCLGLLILLIPLALFDRLYLQDFANHLSRVEITLAIGDPAFAAQYEALPLRPGNAAFDLTTRALATFMTPLDAARLFVVASMVLIATGMLALRRSFGLPCDLVAVAGLPLIYSASFAYGFLPYLMSMGLALHAMALWVRTGAWHPAWRLVFVPIGMTLATFHLYTLGIFALFAAAETWERLDGRTAWRTTRFWLRGMADGLVFVPGLLLLALLGQSGELATSTTLLWASHEKPFRFLTAAFGYGPWWMALTVLAAWAFIIGPLLRWSQLRIDRRAAAAALAMFAAFVVLPHRLGDLYFVDMRILNCMFLVLIAGVSIEANALVHSYRAMVQLLVLMGAMAASLTWLWLPAAAARADVLAITESVPPGSRLFWSAPDRAIRPWLLSSGYGIYHAATHAAAPRRIMVSTTFAHAGQHPLRFRDPLLRGAGNLMILETDLLAVDLAHRNVVLADVVRQFEYALLYGQLVPDVAALLPMSRMTLVSTRGAFRLYAIDRQPR